MKRTTIRGSWGQGLLMLATFMSVGTTPAAAAPADVFFVIDSSASMAEGTALDDAKTLVRRLVGQARDAGHRTALLRFRQRTAVVMGGEGLREVTVEDPRQCERAADVLVPIGSGNTPAIEEWLDGETSQGRHEVVALGDSPLYGSARVALRYIDGLRTLDPRRHCVRALIVLVTDGADNCAGGAELLRALDELEAAGPEDAIQTLVVARHPESEEARRLARVGREEEAPHVFSFDEGDAAAERIAAVDGAAVIASCTPGAALEEDPPDAGTDAGVDAGADTGPACDEGAAAGGCAAAPTSGSPHGWLWLLLGGVCLRARSRRRATAAMVTALAAFALVGCGEPRARCEAPDAAASDAGPDAGRDAPPVTPVEPEREAMQLESRQVAVREALESALAAVTETTDPAAVFDALEGAPREACRALTEDVAFEPYVGFQRGVRGCLATRRCNAADQTLLLQACLAHLGVETELRACRFEGALEAERARLAAQAPRFPDVAPIDDALRASARSLMADLPELQSATERGVETVSEYAEAILAERVRADVARLQPMLEHDAEASAAEVALLREAGWRDHYFLQDGEARLDAVLETPTDCFDAPVDLTRAPELRVSLWVQNVRLTGTYFQYMTPVEIGEVARPIRGAYDTPIEVVIAAADNDAAPPGLPPIVGSEDASPCFAGFLDGERTQSFPLVASRAAECAGEVPEDLSEEHGFGRLIMRTEIDDPSGGLPHVRERVLVDRFGYARDIAHAVANGPTFGADAARALVPMRVAVDVGAGLPGPHEELRASIADQLARYEELTSRARERIGAGAASMHVALPDYGARTFGLAQASMSGVLGPDATVVSHRPWRLARHWRRVFVPGEGIVEKRIFDLLDVPFAVDHPGGASARFEAALRWGALLTEAERLAGMSLDGALRVVHAGDLLRSDEVAFEPFDPMAAVGRFPLGLRDGARERQRAGDELHITSMPADLYGTELLSWWRVDSLGVPTGEIRYEGTLYGGVTAAKAVATFVRCLGNQAVVALTGPRVAPDVSCCAELAFRQAIVDMIVGWVMTGVTGGVGMAIGAAYGDAVGEVASAVGDGVTTAGDVQGLFDAYGDPPCVRAFE